MTTAATAAAPASPPTPAGWLTMAEVCAHFNLSRRTIERLMEETVAAAGVVGLLGLKHAVDRGFATALACMAGPVGLVFAVGFLVSQRAERYAEVAAARHRLCLAEIAAAEREVERLLSEGTARGGERRDDR